MCDCDFHCPEPGGSRELGMAHPERRPLDDAGMISRGSRAAPGQNAPKNQHRKDAARWSPPPWSSASVAHRQSWNRSRHPGFPDRQGDPDLLFLYPPLILISDCMLIQSMPLLPPLLSFSGQGSFNLYHKAKRRNDFRERGEEAAAFLLARSPLRFYRRLKKLNPRGVCVGFLGAPGGS